VLTRWFEHVHLLDDRIIGYWFCLDRTSGTPLWERPSLPADEIVGIEDGIIVANKRWYECDISAPRRGCYGISLETGRVLWTSHGDWLWGPLTKVFGPSRSSDFPLHVLDGKCYCWRGRILDIHSGKVLDKVPKGTLNRPEKKETDTDILGRSRNPSDPIRLQLDGEHWLSHKLKLKPGILEATSEEGIAFLYEYRLFLTDKDDNVKWEFDLKNTEYEIQYRPYAESCRYGYAFLYLIVSEKRTTRMDKRIEVYNPSHFHLLTLDLSNGRIIQDITITEKPVEGCRFEDMDEKGILVSDCERNLHHFQIREPGKK
jgi:hypothetical protein